MRPESVCHDFVNAAVRREERHRFEVVASRWDRALTGTDRVMESMVSLLDDWGAGLELHLYEAALTHFLAVKNGLYEK